MSTSTLAVPRYKQPCSIDAMDKSEALDTVAKRVAWARERRGRSQSEVARAIGVRPQTIQQVETGETKRSRYLPDIADYLRVPFNWIVRGGPLPAELAMEGDRAVVQAETELASERSTELTPAAASSVTEIPVMDARGSMGHGVLAPEHDTILDFMRVSTAWLRRNLTVSQPRNLAVITAYGDSMSPTFNDGDILLVDRGIIDIKLDAVYVLERDGELYVKRVQRRLDGALIIKSDNPLYDQTVIDSPEAAGLRVLGRVVWAWNGRRL